HVSDGRIEVHGDAAIGRNDIAHTGQACVTNGGGDGNGERVDRGVDACLELEQQSCVPCLPYPAIHVVVSACKSFRWMPPNPPFDISTTTSPACASRTIVSTMESTSGIWRARFPALVRSSTSCSADRRSASGRLDLNTPAITVSSA